jgi:hypothetical protein
MKILITESQFTGVILNEYNEKLVNKLIDKFKQEKPNLGAELIKTYIDRFSQIKNSPNVSNKDITQYSWKELETIVDSNQPKRIKAGKLNNDGNPTDANLVYNNNKLRIYLGESKKACIKYGNGYSFCISARGEGNAYDQYRYGELGTPYFVFDDTKTSEMKNNGEFIDPDHLIVLFIYDKKPRYSVTTAKNDGEEYYDYFQTIEREYPRLEGLKDVFQIKKDNSMEGREFRLKSKYEKKINQLNVEMNQKDENHYENIVFHDIDTPIKVINSLTERKLIPYRFRAYHRRNGEGFSRLVFINVGDKKRLQELKNEFLKQVFEWFRSYDSKSYYYDEIINSISDLEEFVNITFTELGDNINMEYLEKVKDLVDEYKNEKYELK